MFPSDSAREVDPNKWHEKMTTRNEWLDDVFVQALSDYLQRDIDIITIYKRDSTNESGRIKIKARSAKGKALHLLNYSNVHYQSIFPSQ